MESIIRKSPIERLFFSVAITPHEMGLALAGLNPSMRISDVPAEHLGFVEFARTAISRAIRNYKGEKISKDDPCNSLDVLLAAYPLMDSSTPEVIIQKISEAIDDLRGANGWEGKARSLGGLQLVNYIKETNRSGRGQHRKVEEQQYTDKLIALLVMLLARKVGHKYGNDKTPVKSEIYNDIQSLAKDHEISLKGIGKSTFYKKIEQSFFAINIKE